jgi:hypothetical protein
MLRHESQSAPFEQEEYDGLNGINEEEEFDQFRNPNGLHDYKERYQEPDENDFSQDSSPSKRRKQQFLSQKPQKYDYNKYSNGSSSESKLPPALRWALEDDPLDEAPLNYQRNTKIGAHLAPLGGKIAANLNGLYNNGPSIIKKSSNTMYGGNEDHAIDSIYSVKKLSSQKARRLQPLRK